MKYWLGGLRPSARKIANKEAYARRKRSVTAGETAVDQTIKKGRENKVWRQARQRDTLYRQISTTLSDLRSSREEQLEYEAKRAAAWHASSVLRKALMVRGQKEAAAARHLAKVERLQRKTTWTVEQGSRHDRDSAPLLDELRKEIAWMKERGIPVPSRRESQLNWEAKKQKAYRDRVDGIYSRGSSIPTVIRGQQATLFARSPEDTARAMAWASARRVETEGTDRFRALFAQHLVEARATLKGMSGGRAGRGRGQRPTD